MNLRGQAPVSQKCGFEYQWHILWCFQCSNKDVFVLGQCFPDSYEAEECFLQTGKSKGVLVDVGSLKPTYWGEQSFPAWFLRPHALHSLRVRFWSYSSRKWDFRDCRSPSESEERRVQLNWSLAPGIAQALSDDDLLCPATSSWCILHPRSTLKHTSFLQISIVLCLFFQSTY